MLPPKCITCGRIFADVQLLYEKKIKDIDNNISLSKHDKNENKKKVLNELHINRYCCRSRILTYVDLIQVIV
jgi:DNA-directed RNA polymerase subunit N (RpoN/RPB10)